ncbi:PTS glucose transporter subunit IIA [Paenibacillus puldeungensis]|uniref:PTS glucose transporter subunit IIA n=1 Tax=Paenibacillus puldeungensis TaxID=696536 RepID=A0ABW3RRB6_9BACL
MFGFRKKQALKVREISLPLVGKIVPLEQVEDEAFSSGVMGKGIAIQPETGKVFSPFKGKVAHLMDKSKHAIILEDECGFQILIHVGMNTVSLKGEGFTAHVKTGDSIEEGQLLLEFDIAAIEQAGYTVVTPVIVPNGQDKVKSVEVNQGNTTAETTIRIHLN